MKIKKSQFKGYVKHIVREAIEEAGEQIPKGKLSQLNPKIATSGKDKKLSAPTGKLPSPIRKANEAGLTSEMGPESRDSALDDVVRLVIKRGGERGLKDPQKIAQVASQLFQHQMGMEADAEAVQASVEKHMPMGENGDGSEGGYDEKEEILLIKVMKLIADKLSAMHSGQELTPVQGDEPVDEPVGEPEEPSEEPAPFGSDDSDLPTEPEEPESEEEPSGNPFGKSEEEPEESPEEPEEPKDDDDDDDKDKVDEEAYKTVAPRSYEVQKDNKALTIQTDPKMNEASFKRVAKKAYTDSKEDKARKIQTEPDINETAYKTQGPSLKTFDDSPQFPDAVNDPENA